MATWQDDPDTGSLPTRSGEVLLATGVAVVLTLTILVSQVGSGVQPDPVAYVCAVGFGAVLLLRRRLPVAVLVLSCLGTFAYYTLGHPPIGVALPVAPALYSAAEAGLTRWAAWCGAVVIAVSLYFRLRDDPQPAGFVLGTELFSDLALISAAVALGYGIRSRRLYIAQQARLVRLTDAQQEREARLRMQSERVQISRELHDTLGHLLTVISLHANVAREALDRDTEAAAGALDDGRDHGARALGELRTMVGVLRSPDENTRQDHSIEDVRVVLDEARATGLDLVEDISVRPAELTSAVDTAVYRIVQEALTNVVRHAHATKARVSVTSESGQVHVRVLDNGQGDTWDSRRGYGMAGMTERARLLGGSLISTNRPEGGYLVHAVLPTRIAP